jgi:hypothetical protein
LCTSIQVLLKKKLPQREDNNNKKGCTQLTVASDKVYQLLVHGRWFSPGTLASSTTKTGRHDIAESGVKHNKCGAKGHNCERGPNKDNKGQIWFNLVQQFQGRRFKCDILLKYA